MSGARIPVLWITGPAGVGKSTVSWQLFTEAAGSGARAAFADADQLCMCYPPLPDDPGRDRIRAYLSQIAGQSAAAARTLDRTRLDAIRIGTDSRTAGESADLVAAAAGWPGQQHAAEVAHRGT